MGRFNFFAAEVSHLEPKKKCYLIDSIESIYRIDVIELMCVRALKTVSGFTSFAQLMEMNNRTRFLQQPQSYLVDAIESGEVKLKETVQENQELEGHLR